MRRGRWVLSSALVALLVGGLLLAGCFGDDDAGPAEASPAEPEAIDVADGLEEPEPAEPAEPRHFAPLTGLEVADEAELERPVVALKVDNAPAARPQIGLDEADIVFTELVEGGTTRFLALYAATYPSEVGPVRSAREVDAEIVPPFEPVFGLSGAAPVVLGMLRDAGLTLREEGQPAEAWMREPTRHAPHNLLAVPSALLIDAEVGPATRPWPIAEEEFTASGDALDRAELAFTSSYRASWEWEAGRWVRSQDGAPHVAENGQRMTAANVVIARVDVWDGERTDGAGNPVAEMAVEGEGAAVVLMQGRVVEARWERAAGEQFRWTTPEGEPLELQPGSTWVELVPTSGAVSLPPSAVG